MGDFWARKLASPPPAQQHQQRTGVDPRYLPQGMGHDQQRVMDDYLARQQLQQGVLPIDVSNYRPEDYEPPDANDPHGIMKQRLYYRWAGNPRGGASENERCPACNSPRYFSLKTPGTGKMNRDGLMVYPAPQCAECGYPKEQGSVGMGGGAKIVGAAKVARQGASPRTNVTAWSHGN